MSNRDVFSRIIQLSQIELDILKQLLTIRIKDEELELGTGRARPAYYRLRDKLAAFLETMLQQSRVPEHHALLTPDMALIAARRDENLACAKLVCPRCATGDPIEWNRDSQATHMMRGFGDVICRATKIHERLKVETAGVAK